MLSALLKISLVIFMAGNLLDMGLRLRLGTALVGLRDVRYDTGKLRSTLNSDGSFNVNLPSSIGEMRFDNIRVKGAAPEQNFGSLRLHDIDLSQASLKISLRP